MNRNSAGLHCIERLERILFGAVGLLFAAYEVPGDVHGGNTACYAERHAGQYIGWIVDPQIESRECDACGSCERNCLIPGVTHGQKAERRGGGKRAACVSRWEREAFRQRNKLCRKRGVRQKRAVASDDVFEAKLADKIGAHNRDDDDTAVESVFFFAQQQSCDDEPDECHVSQGCDERHGRIHRRRLKCVVYRVENGVVYVGKSFEHGWHCNSVKTFGERRYEFGA